MGGLQEAPPLSLRKLRVGGYPFQQVWEQGLLPSGGLGRGSSVLGEKGGWSVGESVLAGKAFIQPHPEHGHCQTRHWC